MDGLRALVGGGSQPSALLLCWGRGRWWAALCDPSPHAPGRRAPGELLSWEPALSISTTPQCGRQARNYAAVLWLEIEAQ